MPNHLNGKMYVVLLKGDVYNNKGKEEQATGTYKVENPIQKTFTPFT